MHTNNEMETNKTLEKGATLLSLYTVESDAFVGGMGQVFRVHHTGWKVDLAMKQPKKELFRDEKQKEAFIGECDHWIKLGLHPHIVSCYYVREIDGIPSIFAEWMDGGSLKGAIERESLYEGNAMERILDISIQFARGLKYAHEQGLIHQDVKPDNLLLTSDGCAKVLTAKVADFGIANARALVTEMSDVSSATGDKTIVVKGHAYTPAYAPPEKKAGRALTRRTDIWSWAVSVLEMFMGDRLWMDGTVAGLACDDYFGTERIPIPEAMKDLLRWCFQANETNRPHDFGIVEAELLKIYQSETGNPYPRPESKAASLTADSLNNRALSYLDLGKPEEAEKCWTEALITDPSHSESLYNKAVHLWKTANIDEAEAIAMVSSNALNANYFLTKLHTARGDSENASVYLSRLKEKNDLWDISEMLTDVQHLLDHDKDNRCIYSAPDYGLTEAAAKLRSVCFSPNGNILVSGIVERELPSDLVQIEIGIQLWDNTGSCIRKYLNSSNDMIVCFNLDGSRFLSGSYDKTVKLWETESESSIYTFEGHEDWITSVCFSPDDNLALSGSRDKTIKLWDINTGQCIFTFTGHEGDVNSVCFCPNGYEIISGSSDCTIKLWNTNTGECIRTFSGNEEMIFSVCFSSDGLQALSGGSSLVKLWDVETGVCIRTLKGHKNSVKKVCFSPDGSLVLSGSDDKTTKLLDIATGRCIRTFEKHNVGVISACFSPDGRKILSAGSSMYLWEIPKIRDVDFFLNRIMSVDTVDNNQKKFNSLIITINRLISEKNISEALIQLKNLREIRQFGNNNDYFDIIKKLTSYCTAGKKILSQARLVFNEKEANYAKRPLCFSLDGRIIFTTVSYRKPILLDTTDDFPLEKFIIEPGFYDAKQGRYISEHCHYAHVICFSSEHDKILLEQDETIKIWDMNKNVLTITIEGKLNSSEAACFNHKGDKVLACVDDGSIRLWDLVTGECLISFNGQTDLAVQSGINEEVQAICFSPDDTMALSGIWCGTMKLWDIKSGLCLQTFENNDPPYSLCFSPDGKKILTAGHGKLKIWDIITGNCICTFKNKQGTDFMNFHDSACFSQDGTKILCSNGDYEASLWDIASGVCLRTFSDFSCNISSVSYCADNKRFGVATEEEIVIYDMEFDLTFPGWHDWDEGARPYLNIFLTLYPDWKDEDFDNILIPDLQSRGFGWLRPEGVRKELEKMNDSII